jgi:hypothetical protein
VGCTLQGPLSALHAEQVRVVKALNLHVHTFPRNRFVGKEGAELTPGGIGDGLCKFSPHHLPATNVTDHDQPIAPRQLMRDFMVKIFAGVLDLGMDGLRHPLLAVALGIGQPVFQLSKMPLGIVLLAVGTCDQGFQPKINANLAIAALRLWFNFAGDVNVPAAPRILAEVAGADVAFDFPGLPEPEQMAAVDNCVAIQLNAGFLERNPPKRPLAAPAQLELLSLLAPGCVLLAHSLDSLRVQTKVLGAPTGKVIQVVACWPLLVPLNGVKLGLIREVPDKIACPRHLRQGLGADAVFDSEREYLYHACHYTVQHKYSARQWQDVRQR